MMFTMNIFNNKYAPKRENPHKLVKNNPTINNTRNCNGTPFRMPLNHVRKTINCDNCDPNVKVLKDPISVAAGNGCFCYDPSIKGYLNKNGVPQHDFIFNHYNVMYKRAKVYEKNTPNNIQDTETAAPHVYRSTNLDTSNSNVEPCSKLVYKYGNHTNYRYGATSQKARINRLKYNNTTAMKQRFYSFKCKDQFKCLQNNQVPPMKNKSILDCKDYKVESKIACP